MICSWTCKNLALANLVVMVSHIPLLGRSNPRSPNYGKYLSRDKVIDFFAPQNRSVDLVKRWLISAGIDEARLSQSENKQVRRRQLVTMLNNESEMEAHQLTCCRNGLTEQWIQFDAPVKEVEALLLTRYHIFEHLETGIQNVACSEYGNERG